MSCNQYTFTFRIELKISIFFKDFLGPLGIFLYKPRSGLSNLGPLEDTFLTKVGFNSVTSLLSCMLIDKCKDPEISIDLVTIFTVFAAMPDSKIYHFFKNL